MSSDTISDFLNHFKNAFKTDKESFISHFSRATNAIAQILKQQEFITDIKKKENSLVIKVNREKPVSNIKRVSKPGCRRYVKYNEIPWPKSTNGLIVISTPKGILTGFQARKQKVGGEFMFEVW